MLADDLYNRIKVEAYGAFNRKCARRDLGHEPSDEEALDHFLRHGGEAYVKEKLGIKPPEIVGTRVLAAAT